MPKTAVKAPGVEVVREQVTAEELTALGVDLDGVDPDDFKRYPVISEGGWSIVVKNQKTLETVHREQWQLLGPIELTSHGLHIA
ncbi:hypothetical protein [Rhodococcus artemisiae]|uniref:Uncharacterized protein n=1 Tax=Rhodococcus artemisiae TaxID=714159 RepID=A0ABU7LKD5_9NOCA|nr:hypothetical protein [Rhodococcus artemisiae]MEE2062003.1 hypothetical protein [Rhodococcus artemisiae]